MKIIFSPVANDDISYVVPGAYHCNNRCLSVIACQTLSRLASIQIDLFSFIHDATIYSSVHFQLFYPINGITATTVNINSQLIIGFFGRPI